MRHYAWIVLDEALAEARKSPRTKPGELWALGDHPLLCGDATNPDDVAKLLAGAAPTMLTTDPRTAWRSTRPGGTASTTPSDRAFDIGVS